MTPAVSRFPHRFPRRPNWAEERGVALVEFALVLPILLVLLFGMLDFGRAFNYWIDSTHLANEGARWAVVNKNPASAGTLQAYIRDQADTNELRSGGTASVPDGWRRQAAPGRSCGRSSPAMPREGHCYRQL